MGKAGSRRVIALFLPLLATDLIRRRQRRNATPPTDAPLLTGATVGERAVVVAVDDRAAALGIAPGMGLADARALAPALIALPAEPARDAEALAKLAAWCDRYTPCVAVDGGDGLFLDITGAAHLFGGEAALLADLLRRVRGAGLAARAALADTPGAAWALARFGAAPENGIVAPPGEATALLAPLPVAALRIGSEAAAVLNRVGLRRIDDLLRQERACARAPIAARAGPRVWQRLDQALGRLGEAIAPGRPRAPLRLAQGFAEPIGTAEDIARSARRLLAGLATRLATQGVGARRLDLVLYRVDATAQRVTIGTARPSRDPHHLFRLLEEKLGQVDPGFGIDLAVLEAPRVEALAAAQIALPDAVPAAAEAEAGEGDLAALVDRLGNRLGADRLWRLAPQPGHAPERAQARLPALAPPATRHWRLPARPLRLFHLPEPVDMVTDAAVGPSLFRWRAHLHRVRLAEGPERLAPEWWRAEAERSPAERATRDYWRVEDEDGRRFWLFHRPAAAGAWFLHGEFA